jgi:hypothetical protein
MIKEQVDKKIDSSLDHMFRNNKLILSAKSLKDMKEKLQDFENPSKDLKVFIIRIKIDPNSKYAMIISISQNTITPDLKLVTRMGDMALSVTYSEEEYNKYKFKMSYIYKIIKDMKEDKIDYSKLSTPISKLIKK